MILNYREWRKFSNVINKAKVACDNSNFIVHEHFVQVDKMTKLAKGSRKKYSGYKVNKHFPNVGKLSKRNNGATLIINEYACYLIVQINLDEQLVEVNRLSKRHNNAIVNIQDYKLSRYICYLIVQNADPSKEVVALGQTYFAIQTRKQELSGKEYNELTENEKRFYQRNLTRKGNYSLNIAARDAGVKNFDKFHNAGYKGLYNGETANDIAKRKKLRYREDILDNMGSDELIANLFRISQTEQKLKNENIETEKNANKIHFEVGKKIRKTIMELGGTMPENLPTPDKSLKELEKENRKLEVK